MRKSIRLYALSWAILTAAFAAPFAWAGDGELLGTGLGAAIGGVLGSGFGHGDGRIATTTLGIVGGGLVGNSIGHAIDVADTTAPSPVPHANIYSDPAPGTYNTYHPNYVAPPAPPPIYTDPNAGTFCREYSQRMRVAGRMQENYGVTCLQADGSWRVVQ